MGFNLDKFLVDIRNNVSPTGIINNPIYTSIIIVLIILIIIIIMFMDCETDTNFWLLMFRSGVYIFLPITIILFAHYESLKKEYEGRYENKTTTALVEATINKPISGKSEDDILKFTPSLPMDTEPELTNII